MKRWNGVPEEFVAVSSVTTRDGCDGPSIVSSLKRAAESYWEISGLRFGHSWPSHIFERKSGFWIHPPPPPPPLFFPFNYWWSLFSPLTDQNFRENRSCCLSSRILRLKQLSPDHMTAYRPLIIKRGIHEQLSREISQTTRVNIYYCQSEKRKGEGDINQLEIYDFLSKTGKSDSSSLVNSLLFKWPSEIWWYGVPDGRDAQNFLYSMRGWDVIMCDSLPWEFRLMIISISFRSLWLGVFSWLSLFELLLLPHFTSSSHNHFHFFKYCMGGSHDVCRKLSPDLPWFLLLIISF